jgi:5S rRNA maturation endonuclease (ribonuclease M5)
LITDIDLLTAKEEIFSSSDPNFWDYVRLKDFTKKTGIEAKDCHAFCAKELLDNAIDSIEKYRYVSGGTVDIYLDNDLNDGSSTSGTKTITISVSNSNPDNKTVFNNLDQTFNYKRSYSSKSNQHRITRGAQGDALKEVGTMGYMLINGITEDGGAKHWKHPIIILHNKKVGTVYIDVDRKHREIKHRTKQSDFYADTCTGIDDNNTDTRVTVTLPALNKEQYQRLTRFCLQYTLFNTHIHFRLFKQGQLVFDIPALQPMSKDYDNVNSVRCYSETEFVDFLTDVYDKNKSVYDVLNNSEFRELRQVGRFEELKHITIEQLTASKAKEIYRRLKNKSMLAMSKLSAPYDTTKTKRKQALIDRYRYMSPVDLDIDKAVYERTSPEGTVYSNGTITLPFTFEVLAIPITNKTHEKSIVISGVNYSTSVNNLSYFKADSYNNGYGWTNRNGTYLQALDINEIVKVSSAGANLNYDDNIQRRKQRQPCVIIAHLVTQRPEYKHGYGKSQLKLEPYSTQIAQTIETAVRRLPLRNRLKPSKEHMGITECLDDLLKKRWDKVRLDPNILEAFSPNYDPWTQSTVWYYLREEYLIPIEKTYHETMIKVGTRKAVTAMISERCEKLEGSPAREQLGITASPRATMYVKGEWFRVDIDKIPALAGKGTDVIFIEKQGVVEIIKHLSDTYGFAFVNTQGHFAEYPRNLVPEITKQGGNVVILTDFDCAGIHIAERIIADDTTGKVKRLGIDMDTLRYFISKVNGIDTLDQLIEHVQESYPKAERTEDKQQPGTNVVSTIIRYAMKYNDYSDERYEYIYDNFEYLTGLDVDILDDLALDDYNGEFTKDSKDIIAKALEDRDPGKARRIELDSVIKVVKANMFAQFIIDKLLEFFDERKYIGRAIGIPKEYFGEKFNILPENTRELFLRVARIADRASTPTEEAIEEELENWSPTEEQVQRGIPALLIVPTEKMVNERLMAEAVASDPDMRTFDERAKTMFESLPQKRKKKREKPDDQSR